MANLFSVHVNNRLGTGSHKTTVLASIPSVDIFIDCVALGKQGDNALGSVR